MKKKPESPFPVIKALSKSIIQENPYQRLENVISSAKPYTMTRLLD